MRRTAAAALALCIVAAGIFAAAPAHAVEPPPGPVDEILDVTSRAVKSVTGTPIGDSIVSDMWKAQQTLIALGRSTASTVPKAITAPAALTRVGGTAVMAPMIGWGLASNGTLVAIAVANGDSYEDVFCSQPDWYQGISAFVQLSIAPDCAARHLEPNVGVVVQTSLAYGGMSAVYQGTFVNPSNPTFSYYCYTVSGTIPSNTRVEGYRTGEGWVDLGAKPRWFPTACGGHGDYDVGGQNNTTGFKDMDTPSSWRMVSSTTGAVLATTTTTSANPTRTPLCTVEGDGSSVTRPGTPYTDEDGIPVSADALGCTQAYEDFVSAPGRGPGFLPDTISIGSRNEDTGVISEMSEQAVPEYTPDEKKGLTVGANGHGLVLSKVLGTTVDSCMTWAADCSGWWEESEEGTSTTSPYRCEYGGQTIALAECGPYRNTFDTKTQNPTITDPISGEDVEWSAGPSNLNSTSPGAGPTPGDACMSGWSSAPNPLEWVFWPVKCAIVASFVPRAEKVEEFAENTDSNWRNSSPGKLAAAVAGISVAVGSLGAGNCGGILVAVPVPDAEGHATTMDQAYLAACPGDFFADWAPIFFWLNAGMIAFVGVFGIKDQLDRLVNN